MKKSNINYLKSIKKKLGLGIKLTIKKKSLLSLEDFRGNNDTLIAGPFLGEFGWELMQWQGYIRYLSKFYKEVIVYGRSSSAYLYKDFVSEFNEMKTNSWDADAYVLKGFNYIEWAKQFTNKDIIIADNRCKELQGLLQQEFIRFGEIKKENEFDNYSCS